jgi:hypothetical protein
MRFFRSHSSQNPRSNFDSQLRLEQLEDRLVPSGTAVVDLTTAGASFNYGDAMFAQTNTQPTGTGVIQSFLRLQGHGSGNTVEQGYNTNARPTQFDEKTDHNFTRAIKLSDVPTVTIQGTVYRQFLLDINEPASASLVSLDKLQLFAGDVPNLTGYDTTAGTFPGMSPVYDMAVNDNVAYVKIDASLSHGSGSGDVYFYVADSVFSTAGVGPASYITLYSRFGDTISSSGGFEEWAVRKNLSSGTTGTPDSLSGYVLTPGSNGGPNVGLAGVVIQLMQTNGITLTATTNANGFYSFVGLTAGTYELMQLDSTIPQGLVAGSSSAGTVNSVTDGSGTLQSGTNPDVIASIALTSGQNGINYDFIDISPPIPPPVPVT